MAKDLGIAGLVFGWFKVSRKLSGKFSEIGHKNPKRRPRNKKHGSLCFAKIPCVLKIV
jgi:hypothetical protein